MTENELGWRLRQLPRGIEPPRDLWPGIHARLGRRAPRGRRWMAGLALAASLVLAIGLGVVRESPGPSRDGRGASALPREADAMRLEYEAALARFEGVPMPEALAPALATLDDSAVDIRQALAADPDAVFLLEQLRRTYARRLSLTQRAVIG